MDHTQHEAEQQARIQSLEDQVAQLQNALIANNDALAHIQRTIVELTADHIQRLFNDQVMLDSIATRIFVAGANAIAHKAKNATNRAPELVVVEGYIPGSLRVTLTEEGPVIEEQLTDTQEWVSGDQLSEKLRSDQIQHVMGDLLISYRAEIGRAYYVTDSVALEEFRKETAKKAMEITAQVDDAALDPVTPAE